MRKSISEKGKIITSRGESDSRLGVKSHIFMKNPNPITLTRRYCHRPSIIRLSSVFLVLDTSHFTALVLETSISFQDKLVFGRFIFCFIRLLLYFSNRILAII